MHIDNTVSWLFPSLHIIIILTFISTIHTILSAFTNLLRYGTQLQIIIPHHLKYRPRRPDYLDPKFHQLACGKIGVNLDQFMMSENEIRASIDHYAGDSQVRCIEGVMVRSLRCFCIYILKDG